MNQNQEDNQLTQLSENSIAVKGDLHHLKETSPLLNYFESNFNAIHDKIDSSTQEILERLA